MKRPLAIIALIALGHFLAVKLLVLLSGIPVFTNLYLGTFGSSRGFESFFSLLLQPVFWSVARFRPQSLYHFTPSAYFLCLVLSSFLYGVLGLAVLAACKFLRRPRPAASLL